ncbi:MAG: hypothetical protein A2509_03735 [Candidatus Edwardsbacteria bacterium RIFOXYD12_FULL_50_11]|uniref:Uncharacterized protein n=1 Tax=Candidatus Edwardsbacteria bacterium GWF2_54_11 TaxID=1817851 RepID=A0A1F5R7Q7_9BACT|nr:MAG: hypothetical protein A2502_03645 [Candidatus Edwardsbacteria bacterium RifOxyC12_full_54_24]OGF07807.1 MAG: hypothetical protein A2273_04895 [Candidatus Edwardsbacteria bacterium RifOxyA12_full_54_48]OGF10056.1 MAG: hypothetical protein A3K15_11310 [Candidatus Edwardsbacteria bacterium GWE2_54_12]OGF10477.1 MAG: hypothetical protein A2024_09005 [Candidatus Edwardsbacteria bacterium GWF2_54_11]OGF14968.1 MAG: hypothetical protein A2509_03735 [Candidatus Edwardsbacteria bacterium RIFOXYD1
MTLNIRNGLHRIGIIFTIASLAGYLFYFIAKGPRDRDSIALAACLIASGILTVLTTKEPWRKKRGPGPAGGLEGI